MTINGNYILGMPEEIAAYLVRDIFKNKHINNSSKFYNCDFAIVDMTNEEIKELTLEEIYINSTGWYGIKHINTGFDNSDLDLFADYYGGGCGVYDMIYDGMKKDECVNIVKELIMSTLNIVESCKEDTLLIGIVKE